jgi:IMP dehydrogenase
VSHVDIGGGRHARVGYELRDVSIVPRRRTRTRAQVDTSWSLDAYSYELPLVSAPLDSVSSPTTCAAIAAAGGQGVLNLEGLWTRYDDPTEVLAEIATLTPGPQATARLQQLYGEPVREQLIGQRIEELRAGGGLVAGALTPQKVERYHHAALEAGLDMLFVQGVVTTAQTVSEPDDTPLDLRDFTARYDIPVVVGGVASMKSALHLMRTGAVGVIVGVGVGSAASTRASLGVKVPQATAIAEVASARSRYLEESGRYVSVIAGGGISTGGDVATAIACGADAVMLGRALARAVDAPGAGAHWGLGAAHHTLPRGQYGHVEVAGTLTEVLTGPSNRHDGRLNLFGGLRRTMAICGHEDLAGLRQTELVVDA